MDHIDLVCETISSICFDATIFSNLNSLTLTLILLIYKTDYMITIFPISQHCL